MELQLLKVALANLVGEIKNKGMVILDYEANAVGKILKQTLEAFVDILRSYDKTVPILLISKSYNIHELVDQEGLKFKFTLEQAKWQKELVRKMKLAVDENIYFLDGGNLMGPNVDEATVDGVHPTTLGFMRMADKIEPVIKNILQYEARV